MTLHLQFSQKSLSLVSIICAEDWSIHFSARKLSVFCYHLMWLTSVKKHFLPLLLKKAKHRARLNIEDDICLNVYLSRMLPCLDRLCAHKHSLCTDE